MTNPTQFFTNTADNVAGEFIKGSSLSFLCSPFQLQIRIAIAQSYARRNAQSCTLTQVVGNITNFMNGNFRSGGWPGFLSFTTVPTNNPFGAFLYGEVKLNTAVGSVTAAKQVDLNRGGGFLSMQKEDNCKTTDKRPEGFNPDQETSQVTLSGTGGSNATILNASSTTITKTVSLVASEDKDYYRVCDLVTTTPGRVIGDSLNNTMKSTYDSLNMAKNFDEIISALISQLVTKILQGGLSYASGPNGYASQYYTPEQQQAQTQAQLIITTMQSDTQLAQQYGSVEQGSIQDIQLVQAQLQTLGNCQAGPSTGNADADKAAVTATPALETSRGLETRIDGYNAEITRSNTSIALLQQFQTRALSAGSLDEITAITQDYQSARGSGQLLTQTDITTAQQNRTSLQSELSTIRAQATIDLTQCNAKTQ